MNSIFSGDQNLILNIFSSLEKRDSSLFNEAFKSVFIDQIDSDYDTDYQEMKNKFMQTEEYIIIKDEIKSKL